MRYAADGGRIDAIRLLRDNGATNFKSALLKAAQKGHVEIIKLFKEWGVVDDFVETMTHAARHGHVEIIRLMKEWLVIDDFNASMLEASRYGRLDVVKQCKEYGATEFEKALEQARCGKEWYENDYKTNVSSEIYKVIVLLEQWIDIRKCCVNDEI